MKFLEKLKYKREMKKLGKKLAAMRKGYAENEKRIQELKDLIEEDRKWQEEQKNKPLNSKDESVYKSEEVIFAQ